MNYYIEKSNDNKIIIKVELEDKFKYIGSRYSVKREIDKFINSVGCIKENEMIIVFGLATGEHILELLNILSFNNKVFVIEPNKDILNAIKDIETYKLIIEDKRVKLLFLNNKPNIDLLQLFEEYNINPLKILVYSNYDKLFINQFEDFIDVLKNFIAETIMRIKTEASLSEIWFRCYMSNIPHILKSSPIDNLYNSFKNKPAIIVSAGPSLNKNINLLKDYQDKAIIICGGRTLKCLLDIGVKPDFVCVSDGGEAAFNLMKDNLKCDIPLIFYEGTNSRLVKDYLGLKIFYTNDKSIDNLLGVSIKSLGYGGSVAHTCIGLAQYLGCDKIILIGQDCAFTNDKFHSEYCSFKKNNTNNEEKDIFYVEDIYGNYVKTNTVLNSFRHRIEQMAKIFTNSKFINCTEGGANIKGTEVMNLKQAQEKYLNKKFSKKLYGLNTETISNKNIKNKLYEIINDYNKIINKCNYILNYCLQINLNDSITNIKQISENIADFEFEFRNNLLNIEFSRILIAPIINETEIDENYHCFIDEDASINLTKKIKKVNRIYNRCKEISSSAIELMKSCIMKL
jgi:hypothetical protein